MLIELENGRPVIVDRALYREPVKGAIIRTVADLQAKATAAAEDSCDFPTRRIRTGPATMAESVWS